jgi:hypothetical protein
VQIVRKSCREGKLATWAGDTLPDALSLALEAPDGSNRLGFSFLRPRNRYATVTELRLIKQIALTRTMRPPMRRNALMLGWRRP